MFDDEDDYHDFRLLLIVIDLLSLTEADARRPLLSFEEQLRISQRRWA